ncbi:MAG: electron transport complex subunit E [Limnochordia bacterium]|jgi:electron transport complex protein RnfE|nr:electron transport complex subunit E [Limnochordia bacterium]MDI9465419.1 electron transport complex subunit E [Bacillota bacterium]NLO95945.1 electron transport complex subunit E [Bacillota bacterium]HAN95725.1 electron transport complex subunit RsxE [Bacillota bacterium]HOB39598.1 electron transport complex subunit E [Limnochordia bacterium]
MARLWKNFVNGLWNENPTFRIMIGLCPVLAVTTEAINGIGMGLATTFVLVCSSALVSLLRKVIPEKVRIPAYIVVIATFVTIVDLFMNAYLPDLHQVLGLFIPLIVVNCIVLGRAEAFASKNSVVSSILDGLGMGLGFTWALTVLAAVRELLGSGSIFGWKLAADGATTIGVMSLPPGAFITLGILMALMNMIAARQKRRAS